MLTLFAGGLAKVFAASIILGAGLPAIFALGVRAMAYGSGATADGSAAPRRPIGHVLGILCFATVVLAIVAGISVILASGLGMTVSFDHVIPTFAPKTK